MDLETTRPDVVVAALLHTSAAMSFAPGPLSHIATVARPHNTDAW